jgi:uncharacterized membrane protein YeaQ/YmgE (transglycosylase-associated protein family)
LAYSGKTLDMQFHFQQFKQKIRPFHLYAAVYGAIIIIGLFYKFFKQ